MRKAVSVPLGLLLAAFDFGCQTEPPVAHCPPETSWPSRRRPMTVGCSSARRSGRWRPTPKSTTASSTPCRTAWSTYSVSSTPTRPAVTT